MPNIPGIVGFVFPGVFTSIKAAPAAVVPQGAVTDVIAIIGQGQREEVLTNEAIGGGADGLPAQFDSRLTPDGRHFQVAAAPVVPGSIELFLNPRGDGTDAPLVRITDTAVWSDVGTTDGAAWATEFGLYPGSGADIGTSTDGYGVASEAGGIDEVDFGLDGYQGISSGSGFYDSRGGGFEALAAGTPEPQHYYVDETTGQIILDYALEAKDTLVATYIGTADVNIPELFTNPNDLRKKHGYPTLTNTISLAADMAFENGATQILAVHGGLSEDANTGRYVTDIFFAEAFSELEKEEVDIIVPVASANVNNEILIDRYEPTIHDALTGNGTYLQESPGGGDEPGINIWPLASSDGTNADFLEVYRNGQLLTAGIDYTTDFVTGPDPVRINLTTSLVAGDKVTTNYRPAVDLVRTIQAAAVAHSEQMSTTANRGERVVYTGAAVNHTFDHVLDDITGIPAAFGSTFRCMFFWPNRIRRVVGGETAYLDGQYIAAAASGFIVAQAIPEPMTNKNLIGFDIERDQKLIPADKRLLGDAGMVVVDPLAAGGKILMGKTTINNNNILEEEPSVVRTRDYTAKSVRRILDPFIGQILTATVVTDINNTITNFLRAQQQAGTIAGFGGVSASVDDIDPRQVNVEFDIQPLFPLNYIHVAFSVQV